MIKKVKERFFWWLDRVFTIWDKQRVLRSLGILLIPRIRFRRGGKASYAEWAHVIGIFQTLLSIYSVNNKPRILDIGCGTGLLGLASYPFIINGGAYTGIDVRLDDIDFSKVNFKNIQGYNFIHLDTYNATYAKDSMNNRLEWPVEGTFDLITALSVWTHFSKNDSVFYLQEVSRVLKKDGYAIITFFCLDDIYEQNKSQIESKNPFHNHNGVKWVFDKKVSDGWYSTRWAEVPEDAIAVKLESLAVALSKAGLEIEKYYPGNWKCFPGLYFQDIMIIKKAK